MVPRKRSLSSIELINNDAADSLWSNFHTHGFLFLPSINTEFSHTRLSSISLVIKVNYFWLLCLATILSFTVLLKVEGWISHEQGPFGRIRSKFFTTRANEATKHFLIFHFPFPLNAPRIILIF